MKASQLSLDKERDFKPKRYFWTVKMMNFSEKYITKVFNLKKFLVSECFPFVRVVGNQGYVSRRVYLKKNL